jgi:type IV pilus assembly protein PilV
MTQLRANHRGFSLIEVLVALVIIGVGMLGIAKIQALAYSSTATASLRSLAAIEASSLAAAMRANQNYWTTAGATAPQTISIVGPTVVASTDATLIGTNAACGAATFGSPAALAAYDVQCWAQSINTLLPGETATVSCSPNVTASYPVGCSIQVTWLERYTGINAQSQGTTMASPVYTVYVEP